MAIQMIGGLAQVHVLHNVLPSTLDQLPNGQHLLAPIIRKGIEILGDILGSGSHLEFAGGRMKMRDPNGLCTDQFTSTSISMM